MIILLELQLFPGVNDNSDDGDDDYHHFEEQI